MADGAALPLTFADVTAAAARLRGVAHRTPVLHSRTLDALVGAEVYLKAENFQRMGAFKFRGGYNAVNVLSDAQRARGVVAFSSGNHAQAVALAARLHGCPATILMPSDAPPLKLAATRGYGAEVIVYDRYRDDRAALAEALAAERGAVEIPPYDHLPVMAGQGTVALELIEEVGALDAMIVCAGGGGFLSGCAVAARHLVPSIRLYGAEPERGNDMQQSLRRGEIVRIDVPRTICDGQQSQSVGRWPFAVIRELVTDVLTASDPAVVEAMRFAFERLKIVLEPSGACALAALMTNAAAFRGQRVGVTLSGGNVDSARFCALLSGAERVD
ncbi:threo-3-hydroxy-L-aspartate ammonia-lyase [Piscinibacter koreensis]|uniref:Threo-3-hydroxy-L-aspartate ammonia-lyase n=1 Tax=Piscinibacter koreensis TaxID=2742824 RepID=A0A7Y6NK00_9BURK|nr:threo-3-hydroxy-L-aspartate ammonia-lyase [Schlegelella koreensis]NUZ04575.1 threo-3-hydroxy-L-aspartate ammonia-lyase [Schlegelella koreensis]